MGVHEHDGFFLRLGLGFAYASASGERTLSSSNITTDAEIKGGGALFEFLVGGTPAPGLVIGGGLIGIALSDPDIELDRQNVDYDNATASLALIGPFINFYIDPMSGFYRRHSWVRSSAKGGRPASCCPQLLVEGASESPHG